MVWSIEPQYPPLDRCAFGGSLFLCIAQRCYSKHACCTCNTWRVHGTGAECTCVSGAAHAAVTVAAFVFKGRFSISGFRGRVSCKCWTGAPTYEIHADNPPPQLGGFLDCRKRGIGWGNFLHTRENLEQKLFRSGAACLVKRGNYAVIGKLGVLKSKKKQGPNSRLKIFCSKCVDRNCNDGFAAQDFWGGGLNSPLKHPRSKIGLS